MRAETRETYPELLPMLDCPRFDGCSAPICPLDRGVAKRTEPFAREPVCRLPKAKRMELGGDLPWRGLWPAELGAYGRWENASPEQRSEQGRQMATRRKKTPKLSALGTELAL